jgi:DegV family protein with EDD domain
MKIAIVTDTDASLPPELAARYGIRQVPITILFGEQSFLTGIDIDDAALFARVDREGKLPTTSAPNTGQFFKAFQAEIAAGADAIVCLCVSSAISATYNAALAARDMLPDCPIEVVDTQSVTMAQGFMCLAAAEAAEAGASVEQVAAAARDVGQRAYVYGAMATLKYLAMSGRVGYVAAGMGNLLGVKPVVTLRGGKLDLLEKVRTRSKALARVVELTKGTLGERPVERLAIVHLNAAEEAARFAADVKEALAYPGEVITADLTAGLAVHTGAGMLGVAFVAERG